MKIKREKQPADRKDYPLKYEKWLAQNDPVDTLADAEITSIVCLNDPDDVALTLYSLVLSPTVVAPWFAGGTDGYRYKITGKVTTAAAREDQFEIIMKIKDE